MGKETKIGLAIIGTLVSIFGVLLFWQIASSHGVSPGSEQAQAPIEPLSSPGISKDSVVVTSKGSDGLNSKLWDTPVANSEDTDQAPVASYMPAADPYAAQVVEQVDKAADQLSETADQAADAVEQVVDSAVQAVSDQVDEVKAALPKGGNPFQSGSAMSDFVEETKSAAQAKVAEIKNASPIAATADARNPLRKLSAQLPIEEGAADAAFEVPTSDEPMLPAAGPVGAVSQGPASQPAADPYASDARLADPYASPPASADPYAATPEFAPATADPATAAPATADASRRNPFDTVPAAEPAAMQAPAATIPAAEDPYSPDELLRDIEPAAADGNGVDEFGGPKVAAADEAALQEDSFEPARDDFSAKQPEFGQPTVASPQAAAPADAYEPYAEQPAQPAAASPRMATRDPWATPEPTAAAPLAAQPQEPAPLPLENGKYTVQPGDTLWSISERVYGTGGYFKALGAHNRAWIPRSDKLTVGTQIMVPSTSELEQDYPSLCPRQRKSALVTPKTAQAAPRASSGSDVYIVNEGDTLFDIARYELGKATRWAEIYDLNRDVLGEDFDYLRPGTELVMPPRAEAASRPSDGRYQ